MKRLDICDEGQPQRWIDQCAAQLEALGVDLETLEWDYLLGENGQYGRVVIGFPDEAVYETFVMRHVACGERVLRGWK